MKGEQIQHALYDMQPGLSALAADPSAIYVDMEKERCRRHESAMRSRMHEQMSSAYFRCESPDYESDASPTACSEDGRLLP